MERLGRMDVKPTSELSFTERYQRQIMLPEVGIAGQQRLADRRVLVVGAGGLGAPILYYLVASGVGHVGIVDFDTVSPSNLQRQILYQEKDLGKPKAITAVERLRRLNSDCSLTAYNERFSIENAERIASGYDLIIDGCDNLATRYLMDQTAETLSIPYLYGAVSEFVGQTSLFHYKGCGGYRDLFADFDASTDGSAVGIIGATAGFTGALMASEAIKILLGLPSALAGKLFRINGLT
ncbi:MAG: HesA/MoeB/ThiF family protein, partial [Porphyromonas sp.]|nr:HesA/MoeB/ThiF family protein [Porphyromonas sp.]